MKRALIPVLNLDSLDLAKWLRLITSSLRSDLFSLEKQFLLIEKRLNPNQCSLTPEVEDAFDEFLEQFAEYADKIRRKWQNKQIISYFQRELMTFELRKVNLEIGWPKKVVDIYLQALNAEMVANHPRLGHFAGVLQYALYPAGFTLEEQGGQPPEIDPSLSASEVYRQLLPNILYFYLDDFSFLVDLANLIGDCFIASYWTCRLLADCELRRQKAVDLAEEILKPTERLGLKEWAKLAFPEPKINPSQLLVILKLKDMEVNRRLIILMGFAAYLLEKGPVPENFGLGYLEDNFPLMTQLKTYFRG